MGLAQNGQAIYRIPKRHHVVYLLMEGQSAGENGKCGREGGKRDRYTMRERTKLMTLNSRFLEALLGHL